MKRMCFNKNMIRSKYTQNRSNILESCEWWRKYDIFLSPELCIRNARWWETIFVETCLIYVYFISGLNICSSHHPGFLHHHQVVPLARISLTLSRHFSLLFIAFGRSSGLHPVSSHSCCMYVRAGRPAFAWPYAGVHRSTSLMSSFLLLQQCPACLVRLTCIVFVMGGKWPYSWRLVGCCRQDLFNIALNILV